MPAQNDAPPCSILGVEGAARMGVLGAGVVRREAAAGERPGVRWLLLALVALLAVFQVVLRPGVRF